MSIEAVEKALWDMGASDADRALFIEDSTKFLVRYPLSQAERTAIVTWDIRSITQAGCDPMLTLMAWNAVQGANRVGEYLERMNAPSS